MDLRMDRLRCDRGWHDAVSWHRETDTPTSGVDVLCQTSPTPRHVRTFTSGTRPIREQEETLGKTDGCRLWGKDEGNENRRDEKHHCRIASLQYSRYRLIPWAFRDRFLTTGDACLPCRNAVQRTGRVVRQQVRSIMESSPMAKRLDRVTQKTVWYSGLYLSNASNRRNLATMAQTPRTYTLEGAEEETCGSDHAVGSVRGGAYLLTE